MSESRSNDAIDAIAELVGAPADGHQSIEDFIETLAAEGLLAD